MVCIDSNAMSYLVDAMTTAGRPGGNLAEEKIALLRIYLYRDDILYISSTVREEYEKITNEENRRNHQSIDDILLRDIPTSDPQLIEARMLEYCKHHPGKNKDCKILAEAELSGCQSLLTYDQVFLKRLRGKTHSINILEPSEYWHSIGIPRSSRPRRVPHVTNPLSRETWWIWQ